MTFADLYGAQLDQALASADRTVLFTTQKRKDACNFGMLEFVRLSKCLTKEGTIALSDNVAEYDIEASFTDFLGVKPGRDIVLKLVKSGVTTYLSGPDFPERSKEELDLISPGWRSATKGTPTAYFLEGDGGQVVLGVTPPPSIAVGDTLTAIVPYVFKPTTMSADADVPFTVGGNARLSLEPYHKAIVHRAAAELEELRKNYAAAERHMKIFAGYVADYLQQRPTGSVVHVARNYFGEVGRAREVDPRR